MPQFHSLFLLSVFNSPYFTGILKIIPLLHFKIVVSSFSFIISVFISSLRIYPMWFDHMHPQLLPDLPTFPDSLNFVVFFLRPSSTVCVTYILLSVQTPSGAWLTYQALYCPKELTSPVPEVTNCQ